MKNFNLICNDEEKKMKDIRKTFVTGYDYNEESNKIEVHFADGSTCSYPYFEKTEQKILSKMEQQVVDASNSENVQKYKKDGSDCGITISTSVYLLLPLSCICYFVGGELLYESAISSDIVASITSGSIAVFLVGLGSFLPGFIIKKATEGIKESKAFKDYKKSKFFLDNKNLINHYILTDKPILKGMSLRAKKQIKKSNGEININDISKMTLRDLRKLKKNVEARKAQEELFNLREQISTLEEGNQLVKTK